MGRYRRRIDSRPYRNYSENKLKTALHLITTNQMSERDASKQFKIARSTLQNKRKQLHEKPAGGQTVLSIDEEQRIKNYILLLSRYGFPMDRNDLRWMVQTYLNRKGVTIKCFCDNYPGMEWVRLFIGRHPDLTERMSANIKSQRACVSLETINQYFNNLELELQGIPPTHIWNYDETNLSDDPGTKKIITKRGCKYPERIINFSKQSTSLMFCGSASGEILDPYVVYKALNLYDTWSVGGPAHTRYNRSKSGWFESNIFEDWFENSLLRRLKKLEDGPKIIIGDNLASHISIHVLTLCEQNNIKFLCLPPNTTHLTQPLDVAFFRPLKQKWREILSNYKSTTTNKTVAKCDFPRLLKNLMESLRENGKTNLMSGFRKSGIHPINRNEVLNRIPSKDSVALENDDPLNTSVIDLLELKRFGSSSGIPEKKRKSKIRIAPGRSVSVADIKPKENANPMSQKNQLDIASSGPSKPKPTILKKGKKKIRKPDSETSEDDNISIYSDSERSALYSDTDDINDEHAYRESEYNVGDFVIFTYAKQFFPGQILEALERTYRIKSMEKSGIQWKWPAKDDIFCYQDFDIKEKIQAPVLSKRHLCTIPEMTKYSDF